MACLQPLSSGEGTKTATGIASPFWPPESPGVLRSWGFGSQRALTSHLWVPSVGRALQGWAQVSRVSPPRPLSPPSPAFPGQGAQGSLGMTCCRRHGGQGASLPGRLCCILVVIAAPSPSHARKAASKYALRNETKRMLPSYRALGASGSHSPLGEVSTASLAVSGCETSVWGLQKGLGLNCWGIFPQWCMQMGLLKSSVQPVQWQAGH